MKKVHLVTGMMALLLLMVSFSSVAGAATLGQVGSVAGDDKTSETDLRPVRIAGLVVEVRDNGVLLRTRLGPVRVRVTEDTVIRVSENGECVEGTLDDIQVGEPARVAGMLTPERVIIARGIMQCRPTTEGAE